jgi:hypothetical protein
VDFTHEECREMQTGTYTVRDLFCIVCNAPVGWVYVFAHDDREDNKFKEGKFILEDTQTRLIR